MATRLKNPFKVTVGTTEVEYDFAAYSIPSGRVLVVLQMDSSNSGSVYAAAEQIDTTASTGHADWPAGSTCEVYIESGLSNLRLKGSASGQVVRGTVIAI
jgi:hypothetical protein